MRVERIPLRVLPLSQVETEPSTYERPAGFRVGIGREHPPFMAAILENAHEIPKIKLHISISEIKQLLDSGCDDRASVVGLNRRSEWNR
jgi:hypothetical protein